MRSIRLRGVQRQILPARSIYRCSAISPRVSTHTSTTCAGSSRRFTSGPRVLAEISDAVPETSGSEVNRNLPASTDLLEVYRGLVTTGKLRWDDEQVRCVIKLRALLESLEEYSPPIELLSKLTPSAPFKMAQNPEGAKKWWKGKGKDGGQGLDGEAGKELIRVLTGEEELANLKTPRGILITGPPGTGKSLLLSLFFDLLPTSKKRRVHYHAFTLTLYRQVFQEMQRRRDEVSEDGREDNMEVAAAKGWRAVFAGGRWDTEGGQERRTWKRDDTIPFVIARDMILEYHVLYFDELQLVDASSAALLRDVLSWYWRLGGVIVSCSNRVPDDLYYHGVQRERMAGFLDALKSRCDVIELDGGRDWRRGLDPDKPMERTPTWYTEEDKTFDTLWSDAGGAKATPRTLSVYSRPLEIPQTVQKTCRFTFADLCEAPLGPADYLSLASTFDTFYIDEVPILLLKAKNEARRLINLVDALYESRCQVYIRAAAPPEELFFPDAVNMPANAQNDQDQILAEGVSETLLAPARPNVSVYNYNPTQGGEATSSENTDSTTSEKAGAFSNLSIFTGEDERFAYKRAVSRLIEMTTSPTYPNEKWLPLGVEGRTWEGAIPTSRSTKRTKPIRSGLSPMLTSGPRPTPSPSSDLSSEDFAVEAGYSRPKDLKEKVSLDHRIPEQDLPPPPPRKKADEPVITHMNEGAGPRHDPPIIKEEHVWGVTDDWGEKAGKWGKGPRVYNKSGKKEKDD